LKFSHFFCAKQDSTGPWKNFQKLSVTCRSLQFVSVAHTPTVTLPRLKAMMMGAKMFISSWPFYNSDCASGYHPSFMDILRNFDAGAEHGDNLLHQVD
jgi:hypothetical protein